MMIKKTWHYPRPEFAEKVYEHLASGSIQGLKIFGSGRMGKTEFLTRDFAPLAEERGHRVVYADLWQNGDDSFVALIKALDQAVSGKLHVEQLEVAAREVDPVIRIKVPGSSAELKVNTAGLNGKIPADYWTLMDEYCNQLADEERPAFLLLDEFQEVTKTPFADDLTADTMPNLSRRHCGLVAVFAGASQDEIRRMLRDRSAPFFAFADKLNLPPLAEDFVDHQLDQLRMMFRLDVERSDALEVFRRFNGNPMILQHWLMHISLHPDLTKEEAVLEVLENVTAMLDARKKWKEIELTGRIAARLLADGSSINGEDGAKNSCELSGREGITEGELNLAVEKLYALGIAERNNGDWIIGDELLGYWIKGRPKYEFGW